MELALSSGGDFTFHLSLVAICILVALLVLGLLLRIYRHGLRFGDFELDEAEFGIGNQTVRLRPNYADRQLAYAIWVELSTRKVGLQIDLQHDVIAEVYDSWHTFFSITRELIKDIPVSRMRRDSTQKVVNLSIELLNEGLRPHLTRWQARFRRWYDRQLTNNQNDDLAPQDIQQKFPAFTELESDLLALNKKLMAYRKKMHELVHGR
jgi:hypothetical protein